MVRFDQLPLDDEGRIDGFQFGGRARRIAEWRDAKEAAKFEALCRKLHHQNYQRNYQRAYYWSKPDVRNANKRRMRARRRSLAKIRKCRFCNSLWINVHGLCSKFGRPHTLYCSKRCRTRWHNRELARARWRQRRVERRRINRKTPA